MNRRTRYLLLCLVILAVLAGTLFRVHRAGPIAKRLRILYEAPVQEVVEVVSGDTAGLARDGEPAGEDGAVPRAGSVSRKKTSASGESAAKLWAIAQGIRPRKGTPGDMSADLEEMERERQRRIRKSLDEIAKEARKKREPSIFDPTW